jgi:hypothetical protein
MRRGPDGIETDESAVGVEGKARQNRHIKRGENHFCTHTQLFVFNKLAIMILSFAARFPHVVQNMMLVPQCII